MKNIRTVLPFYNGMEFIEDQVNSILEQNGLDNYNHELYIYDDGSENNQFISLKKLYENNKSIHVIQGINEGPYLRFLNSLLQSIEDGVDYLFWSDQDDIFLPHKYKDHLIAHAEQKKSLIISNSDYWISETNEKRHGGTSSCGHNFSFDLDRIKLLDLFNVSNFKIWNEKTKKALPSFCYHDALILVIFIALNEMGDIWNNITALHRVHGSSLTNSGNNDDKPWRIWANQYDHYFNGVLPFSKFVLKKKITISEYNKRTYVYDASKIGGWCRWKFENLMMYIHFRAGRNWISTMTMKKTTTKKGRKATKRQSKAQLRQLITNMKDIKRELK